MPPTSRSFLRRLLHRWLVEYNPLYLLSAALVLGGVTLLSRGLVHTTSVYGQLGVTAIAELYAWALIGGAAFLGRIGLRRPAVMLALLAALYQGDLTLHTEAAAYLGWVGWLASLAWLASFATKLLVLGWAMKVRVSLSAHATATVGGAGLVVMPSVLQRLSPNAGSLLVAAFVFALFAFGLWTERAVESRVELDAWGRTVLRRSLRAVWVMWGVLLVSHVSFWCSTFSLEPSLLIPVALLLVTRSFRSESLVWCTAFATLVVVADGMPALFWLVALSVAAVLALHALRRAQPATPPDVPEGTPYRTTSADRAPPPTWIFGFAPLPARVCLLTGSLFAVYLSLWTLGWAGGPWPAHSVALDLAVTLAALLSAKALRVRVPVIPLAAVYGHLGVQLGLICAPTTILGWGASAVVTGFALLLGSLVLAWRFRLDEPG